MDLQEVPGDVGLGNNKKEVKGDNVPKRYPWMIDDNGKESEIKAIRNTLQSMYTDQSILNHFELKRLT